jgi:hypothetical protein
MREDEARVRNAPLVMLDERQLALGRPADPEEGEAIQPVRDAGEPEVGVDLADERTEVAQAPDGSEAIECDHCKLP